MRIDWKEEAHRMKAMASAALDQRDECKAEFSKHLEAWKANNAYHAAEIERLKKALENIRDIGTAEVMKIANDALNGEPK